MGLLSKLWDEIVDIITDGGPLDGDDGDIDDNI